MTMMVDASAKRSPPWLLIAGLVVMVFALCWWLAYYGQFHGVFAFLDVKLKCLNGDAYDCTSYQGAIGQSAIPVYSPYSWYVGIGLTLVGLYLSRRRREH